MARLELKALHKRYGTRDTVHGLDLEVGDREFTVLVGPSGCGKSTTLRMIAGLEDVTSGRILIDDRDVSALPPQKRDIAMVFQSYALYPHMTVYNNMAFGLMKTTRLDRKVIEARVREAAAILRIEDLFERRPNELSGGQRQRVAIGRALVRQPKVFLFDEPLSNLDAKLRNHMRAELKRLHAELGLTVVYVTHDQVEAMTLGTRIAVMADGRLQQYASPMEVYRRPANTFVASFIGAPEMNLVPCSGRSVEGGVLADACGFDVLLAGRSLPEPSTNLLLGLRPEEIVLTPDGAVPTSGANTANGTIERIELLGADALAEVRVGTHRLIARISAEQLPATGQRVRIGIDALRARLFDATTGRCHT